jgi:hypothetical protein
MVTGRAMLEPLAPPGTTVRLDTVILRLADRYAMWFLPLTLAVEAAAWAVGGAKT